MKSIFNNKNLRVAIAVACAGAAIASQAANTGSATATATVITPIALTKSTDLNFGRFAPGAGGTVTVNTAGARTGSGVILSTIGSAPAAAKFDVAGDANASYTITYSTETVTLSDNATVPNTMSLALASDLTAGGKSSGGLVGSGTLGEDGKQSIYVGGVLTVGAAQASGTYTGSFDVTVQYN